MMEKGVRHTKIVKWSDEDQCYIGYCPGIIGPCCHGADPVSVYWALCRIVDEWLEIGRRKKMEKK